MNKKNISAHIAFTAVCLILLACMVGIWRSPLFNFFIKIILFGCCGTLAGFSMFMWRGNIEPSAKKTGTKPAKKPAAKKPAKKAPAKKPAAKAKGAEKAKPAAKENASTITQEMHHVQDEQLKTEMYAQRHQTQHDPEYAKARAEAQAQEKATAQSAPAEMPVAPSVDAPQEDTTAQTPASDMWQKSE